MTSDPETADFFDDEVIPTLQRLRQHRPELPTLEQLDQLTPLAAHPAPPEWEDQNGHVNVTHHYGFHMLCLGRYLEHIGVTEEFLAATNLSTFSVEQHLTFRSEVLIGQDVSCHVRVVSRNRKLMHLVSIMANRSTGQVASVVEALEASVDLGTRRTVAWHPDIAARLDADVQAHHNLAWPAPLTYTLGLP